MSASEQNRTWTVPQNNRKTTSQDLFLVGLLCRIQGQQKLKGRNEHVSHIPSLLAVKRKKKKSQGILHHYNKVMIWLIFHWVANLRDSPGRRDQNTGLLFFQARAPPSSLQWSFSLLLALSSRVLCDTDSFTWRAQLRETSSCTSLGSEV